MKRIADRLPFAHDATELCPRQNAVAQRHRDRSIGDRALEAAAQRHGNDDAGEPGHVRRRAIVTARCRQQAGGYEPAEKMYRARGLRVGIWDDGLGVVSATIAVPGEGKVNEIEVKVLELPSILTIGRVRAGHIRRPPEGR